MTFSNMLMAKFMLVLAILYAVDAAPLAMNPDQIDSAINLVTGAKVLIDCASSVSHDVTFQYDSERTRRDGGN